MKLIIGNKNYSSWSLRGWLVLKAFDLEFDERKLNLFTENFYTELEKVSAAGKVPVLVDDETVIWDSLAICEYVSEIYLNGKGWPDSPTARAVARSVAAEMHSGFFALRDEMPMNCRARRKVHLTEQAEKDICRIEQIWNSVRTEHSRKGPWLFGEFSIADVMYAPVVFRFKTYGIELGEQATAYMQTMLDFEPMKVWLTEALEETEVVPEDEAGEEI